MGPGQKKGARREKLEALEATVHDAIVEDEIDDIILATLLEVAINTDGKGKPLFSNALDEPLFYRQHFIPWVNEGLRIRREIEEATALII